MSTITAPVPADGQERHQPWHAQRAVVRRRRRRQLAHAVIIALGWLLLVAFWARAIAIADTAVLVAIVTVIGGGLLGTLVLTLAWIAHNLRIHRIKGPRRSVPTVDERFTHDFVGRPLDADWETLGAAGTVRISVDDEHKRYRADPVGTPTAASSQRSLTVGTRP